MYYSFVNDSMFCFATEDEYQLVVPMLYRAYGVPIDVIPESALSDDQRARIVSMSNRVDPFGLSAIPF